VITSHSPLHSFTDSIWLRKYLSWRKLCKTAKTVGWEVGPWCFCRTAAVCITCKSQKISSYY